MAPSNNAQEPFDPEVPLQDLATRLRWAELFGNDRPVEIVTEHAGLSEDDQALILGGNAKRLLGV